MFKRLRFKKKFIVIFTGAKVVLKQRQISLGNKCLKVNDQFMLMLACSFDLGKITLSFDNLQNTELVLAKAWLI